MVANGNGISGRKMSKEDGCCSINFLKYLLFIFNFIFMVSGCVVLGVGVWSVVEKHYFVSLLTSGTYTSVAYILIVAGVVVLLVSGIGCVGIWKEDKRALLVYTFLLLFIFLLEAVAGVLAYVYEGQLRVELESHLNKTFLSKYNYEPTITTDIDTLQRQYRCCGAVRAEDWQYSRWLRSVEDKVKNAVPDSCCKTESSQCGLRSHPSNIHNQGCLYKFEMRIREHLILLGAVGLGICLVQVIGMIISGCLYVKLKRYEDRLY